ncbi:hypothetical protein ACS0TY_000166 [Phlomoides rotata]
MASYAALLSLMHTLNQIKNHPRPPISIHQQHLHSLTQNLSFFQDFLERHSSSDEDDDDLETRIAHAAYAAEDVIETHIVDQIDQARSTSNRGVHISSVNLYGGLERVIQDMDLIRNEVMEIKNIGAQHHDQLRTHSSVSIASVRPASKWQSNTAMAFDEVLIYDVLDKLTGQQQNLQVVSIVGMGGIGKTTFAHNIYSNLLIVQRFDILAWVTISQEYSRGSILQVLFQEINGSNHDLSDMSEDEIGERVRKELWDRRYLIVIDDLWSIEAWDCVKSFFPDNNNGSRIMITTRLSNLAFELSTSQAFQMNFLDGDKSWNLLCKIVFGEELDCPVELEDIGKEIARSCRGLPLSIVVVGGLLTKSNMTRAHWEYILQNLNSLINLEDGEYCLQILRTSYKNLPIHLKPCFLYMGVLREYKKIRVTKLIELWVAEGVLRPNKDKRLEEVAEACINELIDRNLILVDKLRWNGKVKVCKIHDLLRDLCLREAQKERFLYILNYQRDLNIPQCMNMERRICTHDNTKEKYPPALESAFLTRSLISTIGWPEHVHSHCFRLLRVYSGDNYIHCGLAFVEAIFKKANLRFLSIFLRLPQLSRFPSSWNLQTLKVFIPSCLVPIIAPSEIWEMLLLRHVEINGLELPDPLCGENNVILEDLQTLSCIRNLKCSETVTKRIPNIKTLKLRYTISCGEAEDYDNFGLNNFGHLPKLQSLNIFFDISAILDGEIFQCYLMQNLSLPHSLKKLTLGGTKLNWEEYMTKIGSLPLLQFLRLCKDAFCGEEWETVEGQFCSLKFLQIDACGDLRYWRTEDTHFPCLEHLVLRYLTVLEEIPLSIGDIPTLKSIRVDNCSTSAEDSVKIIKEEQLELGNTDLQLHISADPIQNPIFLHAISYVNKVKNMFKHQREKYEGFLAVLNDYTAERMNVDGVIDTLKVLFKGHPSLILGFSIFLPEGSDEITLSDEEEEDASTLDEENQVNSDEEDQKEDEVDSDEE